MLHLHPASMPHALVLTSPPPQCICSCRWWHLPGGHMPQNGYGSIMWVTQAVVQGCFQFIMSVNIVKVIQLLIMCSGVITLTHTLMCLRPWGLPLIIITFSCIMAPVILHSISYDILHGSIMLLITSSLDACTDCGLNGSMVFLSWNAAKNTASLLPPKKKRNKEYTIEKQTEKST